jgi:hypothetical protein
MQSAAERRNRTTETFYVNSKCKVLRNGETHTNGHQTHGTDWIGPVTHHGSSSIVVYADESTQLLATLRDTRTLSKHLSLARLSTNRPALRNHGVVDPSSLTIQRSNVYETQAGLRSHRNLPHARRTCGRLGSQPHSHQRLGGRDL